MSEQKVEAVERALSLLDCFDRTHTSLSLAELADKSGMYKSTILRLAASLERYGYLVRRDDGRFRIGPTPGRLSAIYREGFDLEQFIRPELARLLHQTGETASFYVREGNTRVCLYRENSRRAARHHLEEGATLPIDSGASGHILRAFGQPHRPEDEAWRKAGYAVSMGERDPDLAAIAAPLLSVDGQLHGAVAISGIITRFGDDNRTLLLQALKECVGRIRQELSRLHTIKR